MGDTTRARIVLTPLRIGGTTALRNRPYRAPVLEGAGDGDDAAAMLGMRGGCYNPVVVKARRERGYTATDSSVG